MSKKKSTQKFMTNAEIRQSYLDFFKERGHTIVPSMSLVPGADQTLLFTNAGMVQFKDVFLGTGSRPYNRVADSQKCMRVAGKHNDLDDVGRDDTHHTFFEMLGNWSFGDYYKKEAIAWAWELLTVVWGLPKESIWATCFEDELGEIPRDDEAAEIWRAQPGFKADQLVFFGREENFWEMADTGPCGPDSEIHMDRGPEFCNMRDVPGHECRVNGDCQRFLELWNLVFIQYNRIGARELDPLPAQHVDTGMGFERLVSVLQGVDSNYRTDLFTPLMDRVQHLTGHSDAERSEYLTPYRVIADHARASAFLIADGVVPGNIGRNYVTRMIIRRASRFGSTMGLDDPFLAQVAETVINEYGVAYPELVRNRDAILRTLTDEELRFHRTVDTGIAFLMDLIEKTRDAGQDQISGEGAFDLYATYGLPLEITRDIARENGIGVDEDAYAAALEGHRLASGGDEPLGPLPEQDMSVFRDLLADLRDRGVLEPEGVAYDPYSTTRFEAKLVALVQDGNPVQHIAMGEEAFFILAATPFYVESGGQISDTGILRSGNAETWVAEIRDTRQPVQGLIVHRGVVLEGTPKVGEIAIAEVDHQRRINIMRNHTATHLLHAALHEVLGKHARQAGSLVAPDRLRFDFTHPEPMTSDEIERVEAWVNEAIIANFPLLIRQEAQNEAIEAGAMALFGETYGEEVRTIRIGEGDPISFELCGGTHVAETGSIGPFIILSEGSVAAGIRRIEAITGLESQLHLRQQTRLLKNLASELSVPVSDLEARIQSLLEENSAFRKELLNTQKMAAHNAFSALKPRLMSGIPVLSAHIDDADADTLRQLTDRFREENPSGIAVLSSVVNQKPIFIAAISEDLVARGLHAGNLLRDLSKIVGGGGGGKPHLAQAGGKNPARVQEALDSVQDWLEGHLK
jgi:alanyl-tRNA synthetase